MVLLNLSLAAPSATSATTKVSLDTKTPTTVKGARAILKGEVKGRPAGTTVIIQQQYTSGGGWFRTGQTEVKRKGKIKYSERVATTKSRYYRACVTAGQGLKCSGKVLVRVTRPKAGTIALQSWTQVLDAGQSVTATGVTSANLVGRTVELQLLSGKKWATIGSAVVKPDKTLTVAGPVTQAGKAVTLRAIAQATAFNKYTESGAFNVTVYGWYFLSESIELVEGYYYSGATNINGVAYPYAVTVDSSDDYAAFDLQRSCTTFSAVAGLPDDSASSTRMTGRVTADTTQKWQQTNIAIGQSFPLTLDVTGALRVYLYATYQSGGDDDVSYGNAAVRCAF